MMLLRLRRMRSIDSSFAPARASETRTGERKREHTSEFNLLIYQRRTHTNASRLKGISARSRTFIGRERDIRANLGTETHSSRDPARARASDSYFLINNFNDAPRQFRYKAGTYMQIPVSVGRLRIVIYYVRRSSRTRPRAHAGVPADHFSYQRSSAPGDTAPCILCARGL